MSIYSVCEVKNDGSLKPSEFRDFKTRMTGDAKNLRQLQELNRIITKLGNSSNGAASDQFRTEGLAHALPPNSFKFFDSNEKLGDFGLRWYCMRVSDKVVILLNGDRKTTQSPHSCPNCGPHFTFANSIAADFYDALNIRKEIIIDGTEIKFDEDFYLNI